MIVMDFFPGCTPKNALLRAHNRAVKTNDTVQFTLDGVTMNITKDTDIRQAVLCYTNHMHYKSTCAMVKSLDQKVQDYIVKVKATIAKAEEFMAKTNAIQEKCR